MKRETKRNLRYYGLKTLAVAVGVYCFLTAMITTRVVARHVEGYEAVDRPDLWAAFLILSLVGTFASIAAWVYIEKYPSHIRKMTEDTIRRMDAARFQR